MKGVEPPPGTWELLGNCVEISANNTDIIVNNTIRMYYTPEQLDVSELDESTLKIQCLNTTSGEWVQVDSDVNTDEHYVSAIIDHFSFWALMGQAAAPLWTQPWLWIVIVVIVVVIVVAIVAVLAYAVKRRKNNPHCSQRRQENHVLTNVPRTVVNYRILHSFSFYPRIN